MKVKTNLSPVQLRRIGKGLQKLADNQPSEIVLENAVERELIAKVENVYSTAYTNLLEELTLLAKEEGRL